MIKIKEVFKKFKDLVPSKNTKENKKIENMIFALVVLIVTLIIINYVFSGNKEKKNSVRIEDNTLVNNVSTENTGYEEELEENLKGILSKIKGVRKG